MNRWRVEEQIERLTALLRDGRSFPRSFYELLNERGIDTGRAILTDLVEDQGCNLTGTLLTPDCGVVRFDIDFHGVGYGEWTAWGAVEAVSEWQESCLADEEARQGSPLEVAWKMLQGGRL